MLNTPHSTFFRRKVAMFMLLVMMSSTALAIPRPAHAWDAIPAALVKQALEVVWGQIKALLLGIAKRLAIQLAKDAADRLVAGGTSKKAAFITDYKAYIYGVALDEGLIYMNDLLTTVTGGKSSALNYVVAGRSLQQLGMNYMNILNAEVNAAFAKDRCRYNLDQYSRNPIVSLGQGDWRVLTATVAFDCNNPLGLSLSVKEETQRKISASQEMAKTKAVAGSGFTGVEVNGKTVTPGSLIGTVTANTQNAALDMIGRSSEWGELIAAAAGAFVNQAMNNLYQRGFEQVSKNITRELGQVDKKIQGARQDLQRELGPGSQFLRNANQQLGGFGGSSSTGKYTSTQQSVVNFNSQPDCMDRTAGAC